MAIHLDKWLVTLVTTQLEDLQWVTTNQHLVGEVAQQSGFGFLDILASLAGASLSFYPDS